MADTNHLKTMKHGLMKTFIDYDADGRMVSVYEAPADAEDGAACLLTEYEYDAAPSTDVVKMRESASVWVTATMEIA